MEEYTPTRSLFGKNVSILSYMIHNQSRRRNLERVVSHQVQRPRKRLAKKEMKLMPNIDNLIMSIKFRWNAEAACKVELNVTWTSCNTDTRYTWEVRVTDCHLTPPSLSADNLLQFTDEPPFVLAKDLIGPDIGYPQPFWPLDRLISEGSRHTLRLLRGCNPGGVQSCKQPTCYYFLQAYRSTLSVIFRVPFIVIGASRNDLIIHVFY